jgi:threonine dehydrogenase-like Zn-dependent dehydrogenase
MRNKDGIGETPGHEAAGVLVTGVPGMTDATYVVDPWIACRSCEYCLSGKSEQCAQGHAVGLDVPGALAEYIDVPASSVHPVDSAVSDLQASIAEPFGVCTRAIHLANLRLDSRVLVLGAGSLGLISGLLARDAAASVTVSTLYEYQADMARHLGLNSVPVAEANAWADEMQPDVVIEAVGGSADTIEQAIRTCRPRGRIVVIGLFTQVSRLDGRELVGKGLQISGSRLYGQSDHGSELAAAVGLLPRFREEIARLQTHQFELPSLDQAFLTAADPRLNAIKVTVLPYRNR